jgi:N-alpha-acetyl-L-2,4-diaminobutyrate deacetylase
MRAAKSQSAIRTRVIAEIDYDKPGKQFGTLRLPHSQNDSCWGTIGVPIVVVKNGAGPTVLLTGGVHGDEYEGPIALHDLARELDPAAVQGRVIIIPALHFPAVQAGTRLSPIDGRDINRSFPGDADGSFAYMLAHYVSVVLLPLCDAVCDLHSGGRSLDCLPCTMSHILDDIAFTRRTIELARAFGAPYHVVSREVDGAATFQSTAERLRILSMSSELGGGNRIQLRGLAVTERGVRNVLKHFGIVDGKPDNGGVPTTTMILADHACYGFSPCGGIYRPFHELGTRVEAGQPAAAIYAMDDPSQPPTILQYRRSGMLWATRGQGRVMPGDSAAVVVTEWEGM